MIGRLRRKIAADSRIQLALVAGLTFVIVMTIIAAQYGQTGVAEVNGVRKVRSMDERCEVTLPEGWSWRPATSTAVSPGGTELGLSETLHGRPQYPEWEETRDATIARYEGRDGVTVTYDEDTVRVDFGPQGGLSVIQQLDRVACHFTFSNSSGNRAEELPVWEEIILSLKRTYPEGSMPTETESE
jgi:hypothetical protein